MLGFRDRGSADQHWPTGFVDGSDFFEEGVVFLVFSAVDRVGIVDADHRPIGRDDLDGQVVDLGKFAALGSCGAGHAAEMWVESEQVFEGNGAENAALGFDGDGFLHFHGSVEPGGPATVLRDAAFEFIHRFDLAVFDEVVDVAMQESVGMEGVLHGGEGFEVFFGEKVAAAETGFGVVNAVVREGDVAPVLLDSVVETFGEFADQTVGAENEVAFGFFTSGDDEGDAGFIDEDGIGLVDESCGETTLDTVVRMERDLIAEVVEADFVGSGVGDVAGVGGAAGFGGETLANTAAGAAEEMVDGAHPFGVAGGEVVVDGHHVDAFSFTGSFATCEPENGGHGGEGLAFAGLHFGDAAAAKGESSPELDVEHALAQGAFGGNGGEGDYGFDVGGGFICLTEVGVGEIGEFGAHPIDAGQGSCIRVTAQKEALEKTVHVSSGPGVWAYDGQTSCIPLDTADRRAIDRAAMG